MIRYFCRQDTTHIWVKIINLNMIGKGWVPLWSAVQEIWLILLWLVRNVWNIGCLKKNVLRGDSLEALPPTLLDNVTKSGPICEFLTQFFFVCSNSDENSTDVYFHDSRHFLNFLSIWRKKKCEKFPTVEAHKFFF